MLRFALDRTVKGFAQHDSSCRPCFTYLHDVTLGGLFVSVHVRRRIAPNEMDTLQNIQKKFLTANLVDANVGTIILGFVVLLNRQ